MTSAVSDWRAISHLAVGGERHRVGGAERGRVGERRVEIVDQRRVPVRRGVLAARSSARTGSPGGGSGSVARASGPPRSSCQYQSAEQEHVGDPQHDPEPISARPLGVAAVEQVVAEQDQREDVGGADQRDQREREPPAQQGVAHARVGRGQVRPSRASASSARQQPARARSSASSASARSSRIAAAMASCGAPERVIARERGANVLHPRVSVRVQMPLDRRTNGYWHARRRPTGGSDRAVAEHVDDAHLTRRRRPCGRRRAVGVPRRRCRTRPPRRPDHAKLPAGCRHRHPIDLLQRDGGDRRPPRPPARRQPARPRPGPPPPAAAAPASPRPRPVQGGADLALSYLGGPGRDRPRGAGLRAQEHRIGRLQHRRLSRDPVSGRRGAALPTTPQHTTDDFFGHLPLQKLTLQPGPDRLVPPRGVARRRLERRLQHRLRPAGDRAQRHRHAAGADPQRRLGVRNRPRSRRCSRAPRPTSDRPQRR